jgi:hypothetical protein
MNWGAAGWEKNLVVDQRVIVVIGRDAEALEAKAATLLAERAGHRLGHEVSVASEDSEQAAPLVIVGTPSSSTLVRQACKAGNVHLETDLGVEGFEIHVGSDGRAVVAALDPRGLVNGVGRLLRESRFSGGRWLMPEPGTITSVPRNPLRPTYFATHIGNWYCHASDDELRQYIDDLALWGYNALVTWFDFHHYRNFEDGAFIWDRLSRLDTLAREAGMKIGRNALVNESFDGQAPLELRASGRPEGTGWETDLCPSKPAARKIILENRRAFLERTRQTTSLDWLCLWPYDQGGCNCEQCTPWPKTYLELGREIAELTDKILPGTEIQISAWWIGAYASGEDKSFFHQLHKREGWFRTIVTGTVELRRWLDFNRRVPDCYQLLLFPEISMFDDVPWGSRGANPAPRRFAAEMAAVGQYIAGAMPYSEGRYEDINKALWAQLTWDPSRDVAEIVEEYCRYEFGPDVAEAATRLVFAVEEGTKDFSTASQRLAAADWLQARVETWGREGWRWEMLRARTVIDARRWELYALQQSAQKRAEAEAELRQIYDHLQHELYLHDERRSLWGWLYLPFDVWLTLPLNRLFPPDDGWASSKPPWEESS